MYMFRGIRQNSTGIALWPAADVGVAVYSGDQGLQSVGVIVAQEFSAEADGLTNGQADGGSNAGTYLEIGAAPGYAASKASVSVPVKVGLSLSDYYELNTGTPAAPVYVDNKFGYFSIAALVTVPLGGTTGFGAWNVHGGVEYQALGDTTKAFNGGDSSRVIGSFGIGFSY